MLKALLPTLAAALLFPDLGEAVVVAAFVQVGHAYPIYHRFVGGYGISPLLGSLLFLDWRALVFAIVLLGLFGLIVGNAFIAIESWPLGLFPWFAWQGSEWLFAYAVVANVIYWWRSRQETSVAMQSFCRDRRPWRQRMADFRKCPDPEAG